MDVMINELITLIWDRWHVECYFDDERDSLRVVDTGELVCNVNSEWFEVWQSDEFKWGQFYEYSDGDDDLVMDFAEVCEHWDLVGNNYGGMI